MFQKYANVAHKIQSLNNHEGVKYFLTKQLSLRLDGRALGTLLNSNSAIFCSGGYTISVSGSTLWQFEGGLGLIFAF